MLLQTLAILGLHPITCTHANRQTQKATGSGYFLSQSKRNGVKATKLKSEGVVLLTLHVNLLAKPLL